MSGSVIEVEKLDEIDATEFRVFGSASFAEVTATIEEWYCTVGPAVLWDITQGSIDELDTANFRVIAEPSAKLRPDGLTAYVGSVDLEYGLLRMYQGIAARSMTNSHLGVFRERKDAIEWLRTHLEA